MYTLCWSPKGGSGTTVTAAALALLTARQRPSIIVDLGGDAASALGAALPAGPGTGDWLTTPMAPAEQLLRIGVECSPNLVLIGPGHMPPNGLTSLHGERLAAALAHPDASSVVIDAGRHVPSPTVAHCAWQSLIVIRPCYLALRRAAGVADLASGIVVVNEPGRSLGRTDVERALGRPVVATVLVDPAVARAVDAGLLSSRLPASLVRALGPLVENTA